MLRALNALENMAQSTAAAERAITARNLVAARPHIESAIADQNAARADIVR